MQHIMTWEDAVPDPVAYRDAAIAAPFQSLSADGVTFHGMAVCPDPTVPSLIAARVPGARTTLSLWRRSPHGQIEPNFIHTDADMGEWTAILYLNPASPMGDGTTFWRDRRTRALESLRPVGRRRSHDLRRWEPWHHVAARFNRLILFPATLYHSRGLYANYGEGDTARLIQVLFGIFVTLPAAQES